uniref:Uncharacterized protein n=1 Tax=Anguilla anguilla TaxID=7936 RepID=A0A0E9W097_ANGAN
MTTAFLDDDDRFITFAAHL